ncbi:NADH-quinone oxidoreductase subunit NuoG [Candidatus Methylospira mobilis]|uniref:NADH-quinone oxidoreductase n=1 Tax=Candidatus Methylospira mobilis TaxID=1808979 RepID=A0A5Q0BIB1_9GAMM|nr:NADH-quinone oxidoreductase subunit NuoG [Candidatus Methylospira mobilis]QFY41931.1 NADH-quinone oxidoreductase subunit NuoG [Candidatus Methylospira mobilis]WNV02920.1 NADH-quinone oxidoreductase subunit NuoG [Candidatus Methylospira mobilis]
MSEKVAEIDLAQPQTGPQIEVDGTRYPVAPGDNLLRACLSLGLDLPYFCWHPSLGSVGACRQCAVIQYRNAEDQHGRIVMACMTPVADGMRIGLQHPDARRFRAGVVELLMTNHPHDCPVCEEGGECHLQDMTEMTGHTARRFRGRKRTHRNQYLGPFINHEMNRCIACYRCVRYYQDYCGGSDLQAFASHNHVYFGRERDGALENEFSGNLVEVCPTGVFTDRTFSRHYARKWDLQTAPSICVHCGVGCNISPGERYGSLRRVVNRYHGEINGYFLCDRGRFGYDFVNSEQRLLQVLPGSHNNPDGKGSGDCFSWLLDHAAGVIGIGSPRASVEANFALRELVGAENFHLGFSESEYLLMELLLDILHSAPVRIASLRETEEADAVFILGEDVTQTAPRLALSLRQSIRKPAYRRADQLGIPRWQDASVRASSPQERSALFIACVAATRLDDAVVAVSHGAPEDLARLGFAVAQRIHPDAPDAADLSPEWQERAALIAQALSAAQRPLIVSGLGCQSAAVLQAAAQVASALAARRGGAATDVHFAVPECNSMGLAMLGGASLAAAFAAVEEGRADTVVVLENDLYRRAPKKAVDRFLSVAKSVVAIDHIRHETVNKAQLALPAATYAESEGTLISSEGRAQRYFPAFPPSGDVRASWRWVGGERGFDQLLADCAEQLPVFSAIKQAAPSQDFRIHGQKIPRQTQRYSGRTAMLADQHIHEPKQTADSDSALAFSMEGALSGLPPALRPFAWSPGWNSNQSVNKFQQEIGGHLQGGDPGIRLIEARAGGEPRWFTPAAVSPPSQPPRFRLVSLYHLFGSEELSALAPAIAERVAKPYIALHPDDAAAAGLEPGVWVEVEVAGETQRLPLIILPSLARGLAALPSGLNGLPGAATAAEFWEYRPDASAKQQETSP